MVSVRSIPDWVVFPVRGTWLAGEDGLDSALVSTFGWPLVFSGAAGAAAFRLALGSTNRRRGANVLEARLASCRGRDAMLPERMSFRFNISNKTLHGPFRFRNRSVRP